MIVVEHLGVHLLAVFQRDHLLYTNGEGLYRLKVGQEPAVSFQTAAGSTTERAFPRRGAGQLEQVPPRSRRELLDLFLTVMRSLEETSCVHRRLRSTVEPDEGGVLPGVAETEEVCHHQQLYEPAWPPHGDLP